jgi:membrane protein implicated in regulation of membrane protease activity
MPEIRDTTDGILLGLFFFGLLLTVGALLLGVADLGLDHGDGHDGGGPLPASLGALLVLLTWLGGVTYILRSAADWPLIAALPVATLLGLGVAMVVQRAVRKLSDPAGSVLDPEHYRLPGTLGRVSSPIRAGGTGEVIYELGGVRQVVAARADGEQELPRGAEIVVLRVDRGTAIVDLFDPFTKLDRGDGTPAVASDS